MATQYLLDVRYSHNDQWTVNKFDTIEALQTEAVYKVMHGWEVKLNDATLEFVLED